MAEEKSELRPDETKKNGRSERPAVTDRELSRVPSFNFSMFCNFRGMADRTKEENERFQGRFFQFSSFGTNFDVRILDNALWQNPPRADQGVWVEGRLSTNSRLRISLDARTVKPATADNPPPTLEEMSDGAAWSGIGKIIKSSYQDAAGNTNYTCRLISDGFLYNMRISQDFYDALPDMMIAKFAGLVRPADTYQAEYQGRRLGYEIELTTWKPLK